MFERPPSILKKIYPSLTWNIEVKDKRIFLTFDDGPHPKITPVVLDILDKFNAKAVFFCVGDNVRKHPDTYTEILKRGHKTGIHTYNHLNGWKTDDNTYFQNIEKAAGLINSNLLRPPYGRISSNQIKILKKKYRIIMWSVLTRDYDSTITEEQCLDISIKNTIPGSIVVFHDSEKANKNLMYALPKFLEHFTSMGYNFSQL